MNDDASSRRAPCLRLARAASRAALAAVLAWAAARWGASAPTLSDAQIETIRERLQKLQRLREARQAELRLTPWSVTTLRPARATSGRDGAACLTCGLTRLRAFWTLTPLAQGPDNGLTNDALTNDASPDDPDATPSKPSKPSGPSERVPPMPPGPIWIALAPGRWRFQLTVGDPAEGKSARLAPFETRVAPGGYYELALPEASEAALAERLGGPPAEPAPSAGSQSQGAQSRGLTRFAGSRTIVEAFARP
jgi:hypothetical protein